MFVAERNNIMLVSVNQLLKVPAASLSAVRPFAGRTQHQSLTMARTYHKGSQTYVQGVW